MGLLFLDCAFRMQASSNHIVVVGEGGRGGGTEVERESTNGK